MLPPCVGDCCWEEEFRVEAYREWAEVRGCWEDHRRSQSDSPHLPGGKKESSNTGTLCNCLFCVCSVFVVSMCQLVCVVYKWCDVHVVQKCRWFGGLNLCIPDCTRITFIYTQLENKSVTVSELLSLQDKVTLLEGEKKQVAAQVSCDAPAVYHVCVHASVRCAQNFRSDG